MKLAICTPTTGNVRIEWAESLLESVRVLQKEKLVKDWKLFFYCSSVIPANRNNIVNTAMKWGATHFLFIDDDMRFPVDAMRYVIKYGKQMPIFGANCIKRKYPIEYMATDFEGKQVVSTGKTGIEEVAYTGNSFVMVSRQVFEKVPKPWFAFPYVPDNDDYATEDFYFYRKATEHNFPCIIDHELSQVINHVGINEFKPEHAYIKDRPHSPD